MAMTPEELDAMADKKIADAVRILREDGMMTSLREIREHLKIGQTDPDQPPAPPKKEKPEKDPVNDPEPPKRNRHWLYGDLDPEKEENA